MTSTSINILRTPTSELTLFAPRAALNDDILAHLAWFLSRPTLLSFSLTCHALHRIALPPLLHTIVLPRGPAQHFRLPALRDFLLAAPDARGSLLHALHIDYVVGPPDQWSPWREFGRGELKAGWSAVRELANSLADILECATQLHTFGIAFADSYVRNEPRISAALTQCATLRVLLLRVIGPATIALLRDIRAPLTDIYVDLDKATEGESAGFLMNFAASLERVSLSGIGLAHTSVVCPRVRNVRFVHGENQVLVPIDFAQLLRLYPAAARVSLSCIAIAITANTTARAANVAALRTMTPRALEYLCGRVGVLWQAGVAVPVRHLVLDSRDLGVTATSVTDVLRDVHPASLTLELEGAMRHGLQNSWIAGITQGVQELTHLVLHVQAAAGRTIHLTELYPLPFAKEVLASVPTRLIELKLEHMFAYGQTENHAAMLLPALREHWARTFFEVSNTSLSCILYSDSTERVRWTLSDTTVQEGALPGERLSEEQYAQARKAHGLSDDSEDQFLSPRITI